MTGIHVSHCQEETCLDELQREDLIAFKTPGERIGLCDRTPFSYLGYVVIPLDL
jgi:hypothetical protein